MSDFEQILEKVGSLGLYQILLALNTLLQSFIFLWNFCFLVFCSGPVTRDNFALDDNRNLSSLLANNSFHDNHEDVFYTMDMEWELDSMGLSHVPSLISFLQLTGTFLGAIPAGYFADKYGRKITWIIGLILTIFCGVISAFSPNWIVLAILRLIWGVCCSFVNSLMVIMLVEIAGTSHRFLLVVWFNLWELGFIIFSLLAYLTQNWRTLICVMNLLNIPLLFSLYYMEESPRWLIHKGKTEKARKALSKIARVNRRKLETSDLHRLLNPPSIEIDAIPSENQNNFDDDLKDHPATKWNYLWHDRDLFIHLLCVIFASMLTFCILYILILNAGELVGNKYLNVALFGLIKLIPVIFVGLADYYLKIKRRSFLLFSLSGVLVCCAIICILLLSNSEEVYWLFNPLYMIASCLIYPAIIVMYIYPGELFPTLVRSRACGICTAAARMGTLLAPAILAISPHSLLLPPAFACGISLVTLIIAIFGLPETRGKPLPELHLSPTEMKLIDANEE